ncbi:MAG: GGDEF domain-containing protein [Sterolibacterium sp.]
MIIDPRTAAVFFSVTAMTLLVLAFFSFRRRLTPAIRLWLVSLLVHAAAWSLVASRGEVPGWASSVLAFSLLSLHHALVLASLLRFYDLPLRRHWPYWPVPLMAAGLLWFAGNPAASQMVGGLIFALQMALVGALLFTRSDSWPGLRIVIGGTALAGSALLLLRVALQLTDSALPRELLTPSPEQSGIFLFGFIFRLVFAFSFLLLLEAQRYEELRVLATRDPLTGARNRRSFFELVEQEVARQRRSGEALTLMILDLDHFKQVNDDYGHLAGDQVLREVKAAIEHLLRLPDSLARYGGEEFCILAPNTDAGGGATLAERVRNGIAGLTLTIGGKNLQPVTASIGVATLAVGESVANVDELLARADAALYQAKNAGRNRVVIAAPAICAGVPEGLNAALSAMK